MLFFFSQDFTRKTRCYNWNSKRFGSFGISWAGNPEIKRSIQTRFRRHWQQTKRWKQKVPKDAWGEKFSYPFIGEKTPESWRSKQSSVVRSRAKKKWIIGNIWCMKFISKLKIDLFLEKRFSFEENSRKSSWNKQNEGRIKKNSR